MAVFLIVFVGLIVAVVVIGMAVQSQRERAAKADPSGAVASRLDKEQKLAAAKRQLSALESRPVARVENVSLFDGYVVTPDGTHDLTSEARAAVDTAGNIAVTRRATLTRFALLGFGPALLFQKKDVHDERELYLLIEDGDWMSLVRCKPEKGEEARRLATKINQVARSNPQPAVSARKREDRAARILEQKEEISRLKGEVADLTSAKSEVALSLGIMVGLPALVIVGFLLYLLLTG